MAEQSIMYLKTNDPSPFHVYLETKKSPAEAGDELKTLAQRSNREADVSRELLVSLVQRIEINKQKSHAYFFAFKI